MINRRYTVGLLALLAVALGCVCVTPVSALERVVFGTSSSQLFSPSEAVFLQTEEGEESFADEEMAAADSEWQAVGEAEAEEEAEAALEAEGDSESESEAEAEAEAEEEGDALADEDEFDLDVEADESAEQELDAAAQQSLQQYAAAQGALDAGAEAEAEADASAALEALSSEAVLSEAEAEMEMERDTASTTAAGATGAATAGKQGKAKGKGKKKAAKKPAPGLALSQLNLRDDKGQGAKINLAQGKGRFSMGVNAAGVFSIDMEHRTVLSVSGKSGMVRARGDVTVWNTLSAGSLTLNQVPQWKLVREDTFEKFVTLPKRPVIDVSAPAPNRSKKGKGKGKDGKPAVPPVTVSTKDLSNGPKPPAPPGATGAAASTSSALPASAVASASAALARDSVSAANKALAKKARGWLYDDVIRCNGFSMLSAKHGRTIATKYKKLPKHTQIRITATVHFIDDWQGETAWMKLNDQYVWTESHDQKGVAGKFSVCGSELYPESRFSAPIDVIWSHNQKQLTLSLGSNLDEGSDARFAVSNVAIYTRDTSRRKPLKKKAKKVCKKDPKTKKMVCKEVKPCKKGKDGKCLPKPKPAPAAAPKKF